MKQRPMTRLQLLKLLENEAREYRQEALASIERNGHMNNLSQKDFLELKSNQRQIQKLIDALLVDFINIIGVSQCLDYGLYTKHLKLKWAKMVLHHDDPPCTAQLTTRKGGRWCPKCKLHPDMQSTCFYSYCPSCDVRLKNMKCPKCGQTFDRPSP